MTVGGRQQRQLASSLPPKICLTFSLRTRTYFVRVADSSFTGSSPPSHSTIYSPTVVIVLNSKQSGRHEDAMASELLGLTEFQSTS